MAEAATAGKKRATKKKRPRLLAVIDQNGCTGCEACLIFCPVDCIEIVPNHPYPELNKLVEVDLERCIGCQLCAKYCPWDTIPMLPTDEALEQAPLLTVRTVCYPDGHWPTAEEI